MNKTLYTLLIAAGITVSATVGAQTVLLQDNFDSYTPGSLTNGAVSWPSSIPGTAQSWVTSPTSSGSDGGLQQIVAGSAYGRSGNVYGYQESAARQLLTHSSVQLPTAYTGSDNWTLSVDFYIDQLSTTNNTGVFNIAGVWDGGVASGNNVASVALIRSGNAGNPIAFAITTGGTSYVYDAIPDLQSWYTLTITGNNLTQDLVISAVGEDGYQWTRNLSYGKNTNQIDTISIGDTTANAWSEGRANSVYLDNLSLTTIPEPGAYALLAAGTLLWVTIRRFRKHESGNAA